VKPLLNGLPLMVPDATLPTAAFVIDAAAWCRAAVTSPDSAHSAAWPALPCRATRNPATAGSPRQAISLTGVIGCGHHALKPALAERCWQMNLLPRCTTFHPSSR